MKPKAYDLFCGKGGWTRGSLPRGVPMSYTDQDFEPVSGPFDDDLIEEQEPPQRPYEVTVRGADGLIRSQVPVHAASEEQAVAIEQDRNHWGLGATFAVRPLPRAEGWV